MANPEGAPGRTIHAIGDRLKQIQIAKNTFRNSPNFEEGALRVILNTERPIAASENIIPPEKAQVLLSRVSNIRTFLIDHAPTYEEEPGSRVDNEAGWGYNRDGFKISADDLTKDTGFLGIYLLSIAEVSPYDSAVHVWFSLTEREGYNLEVSYFETAERKQGEVVQRYVSCDKPIEEMPEDDALIIEDLLKRVAAHLSE